MENAIFVLCLKICISGVGWKLWVGVLCFLILVLFVKRLKIAF